jgi:hypothetical protein
VQSLTEKAKTAALHGVPDGGSHLTYKETIVPILDIRLAADYHRLSTDTSYGVVNSYDEVYTLETALTYRAWSRQPRPYITTLPYVSQKVSYVPVGYYVEEDSPFYSANSKRTGWVGVQLDYLLGLASQQNDEVPLADAMNGAIDSIKGASWNFPVFAAEANKTIDSVHLLAQKATKGWAYFKKFRK